MSKLSSSPPFTCGITVVLACATLLIGASTIALPASWSNVGSQDLPTQPNQFEIKSNVNVVLLQVTVRDREKNLIGRLDQQNFRIYEDGASQQIETFSHEDIPITAGLVVDNSGSMRTKRPEVITAALAFLRSSNPQDEMFVVNFNDRPSFGLPQNVAFTDQPGQLQLALSRVEATGRTALYDAICDAIDHLGQGSHDKKALIVVSDGGDNASRHTLSDALSAAVKSDATIYTIGVFDENDRDKNPQVLTKLARATGGNVFLPGSLNEVRIICEDIALEIRNQYTVTYVSSNKKQDGSFRSVKIKVDAPDRGHLIVRARPGYYAPATADSKLGMGAQSHATAN